MKNVIRIVTPILLLLLITACSNGDASTNLPVSGNDIDTPTDSDNKAVQETRNEEQVEENSEENSSNPKSNGDNASEDDGHSISQKEMIWNIASQVITNFAYDLPEELPYDHNKYLTGTTENKKGYVAITYYATDEKIPVNDQRLKDETDAKIARIQIKQYDSEKAATKEIAFEDYSQYGGNEVDLGHGLTGYQDAGAGSVFTSWNEGRWALTTRTRTESSDQGIKLAKEAVEFLETNALPAPQKYGKIKLDVESSGTIVKWQKGNIIYTIDQVKEPLDALKIAVAFP